MPVNPEFNAHRVAMETPLPPAMLFYRHYSKTARKEDEVICSAYLLLTGFLTVRSKIRFFVFLDRKTNGRPVMKSKNIGSTQRLKITVFFGVLVLIFCVCLAWGRFNVPVLQAIKILVNHIFPANMAVTWTSQMENVIINIRLPRVIGASMVGSALALSGATYQGLFKNPLVSPDLLGVSSGACVGAAAAILLGLSALEIEGFALVSGLIAVLITTSIPKFFKNSSSLMLVLAGVIVSGFMNSLLGLAKYVADPYNQLYAIVYWTLGSFTTTRMRDVLLVMPVIVIVMIVLLLMRWRVNLLSLGDQEAKSLGVNIKKTRGLAILCATILTACSVCLCGTIGWVGLIIPHLSRLIIGHDNRYLLPLSTILGAIFMVVIDTLARSLTGSEIPLSILTGILGAPLFVWLLARQKARIG